MTDLIPIFQGEYYKNIIFRLYKYFIRLYKKCNQNCLTYLHEHITIAKNR